MKDRKKPEKFLLPHGMPSDEREFAFSSRVPPKALKIKALYKSWHYQSLVCLCQRTSYHLSIPICQFFTPSARLAHDECGWHHSRCDDAAWPQEYAAVGRQYCVKPGHGAAPWLAMLYTCC